MLNIYQSAASGDRQAQFNCYGIGKYLNGLILSLLALLTKGLLFRFQIFKKSMQVK